MLVVGLGFGLLVSALMSWLFVSLPYSHEFSRSVNSDFAHSFYAADGTPKPIAFLAYFGFLFVIPRWWRQADPMRSTPAKHLAHGGGLVLGRRAIDDSGRFRSRGAG